MTDLDLVATQVAGEVMDAVRGHTMRAPRTAQSDAFIIGMSEIGACRSYLLNMFKETPRDEEVDPKWPAFVGTALGDRLEAALSDQFGYRTQVAFTTTLPSGRQVPGHCDVLSKDAVWDFKAKDGLEAVRKDGFTFRERVQIMGYLVGAIQNGHLPEDALAILVAVDRSGRNPEPYVWVSELDLDLLAEAEERLSEVEWAFVNSEEVPRDEPIAWCAVACPFFSTCRMEHQPSGLVDDPGHLTSLDLYVAGRELKKQGEQMMDEAKRDLEDVNGSTGELVVRHTWINETVVESYPRAGYWRMDVRRAPKPKGVK